MRPASVTEESECVALGTSTGPRGTHRATLRPGPGSSSCARGSCCPRWTSWVPVASRRTCRVKCYRGLLKLQPATATPISVHQAALQLLRDRHLAAVLDNRAVGGVLELVPDADLRLRRVSDVIGSNGRAPSGLDTSTICVTVLGGLNGSSAGRTVAEAACSLTCCVCSAVTSDTHRCMHSPWARQPGTGSPKC